MKFGIRYSNTGPFTGPKEAVALVQAAEAAGFESAWTVEHVLIPPTFESKYPYTADGKIPNNADETTYMPDPMMWMMYCAARTETIKFGTAVMILPVHNPVILAKQAATFDNLSNGRLMLGFGVGWLKEEFEAINSDFHTRGRRADEYIDLMRYLWGKGDEAIRGDFNLTDIDMQPKPVNGSVPIHIGGDSVIAARRAGMRGDGYFPARGLTTELLDALKRGADEVGRDWTEIEITVSMPEDEREIEAQAALGVDRLAVPVTSRAGMPRLIHSLEHMEEHWSDVIQKYAEL